jgi:error-prone DNA polymerase
MTGFAPLHVHSSFSPGWGVHGVEELCAAARAMGLRRLALTDRNGLYGIPRFLEAARAAGLAPIIGAEALAGEHRAVLLARDAQGYANLCRLLSELHCHSDFDLPAALDRYRRGLIILTDHAAVLAPLRRPSPEGLFVELSPGHGMHRALALARELRLPPVATSRATLLTEQDLELHRVLRAVALNTKLSRLPAGQSAGSRDRLLSPTALADHFPHCPEALENAVRIAGQCKTDWDFSATIFPAFRGLAEAEAFAVLQRPRRRWRPVALRPHRRDGEARLHKELAIIRDKGFAHYFLVVGELAGRSPRTCGRGSAAASLVAYCLGITHVDPLRYNLFFERFLNEGRSDPPDIDIDFPWDERDAVLDFAFARYGAQRAAMVANQVGFKSRGALREVAKVFGLPADDQGHHRRLSGYWSPARGTQALAEHPLFRGEQLSSDWQRVIAWPQRLDGQLRHLAQHCGGLVVVPDEIRRYVPVEVSPPGDP